MSMHELAWQVDTDLYPDLVSAGGLVSAFEGLLASTAGKLTITTLPNVPYVRVVGGNRSSQVNIGAHERIFLGDFWSEGVLHGNAATDHLVDTARAIHCWIETRYDLAQMEYEFGFFHSTENGKAYEAGSYVEFQWNTLLKNWSESESRMANRLLSPKPLIEAAMRRPILRQLFPFTSHYALCFSRTAGYPFTEDCPHAEPVGDGRFRAYAVSFKVVRGSQSTAFRTPGYDLIGEGDAEQVADMLAANLPSGCGPAISGTANDLER